MLLGHVSCFSASIWAILLHAVHRIRNIAFVMCVLSALVKILVVKNSGLQVWHMIVLTDLEVS